MDAPSKVWGLIHVRTVRKYNPTYRKGNNNQIIQIWFEFRQQCSITVDLLEWVNRLDRRHSTVVELCYFNPTLQDWSSLKRNIVTSLSLFWRRSGCLDSSFFWDTCSMKTASRQSTLTKGVDGVTEEFDDGEDVCQLRLTAQLCSFQQYKFNLITVRIKFSCLTSRFKRNSEQLLRTCSS